MFYVIIFIDAQACYTRLTNTIIPNAHTSDIFVCVVIGSGTSSLLATLLAKSGCGLYTNSTAIQRSVPLMLWLVEVC